MNRGLDLHVGAVVVGVFVDQIGSFTTAVALAAGLPILGVSSAKVGQALYEASCIAYGGIGGFTAARFARRSMIAHGMATSFASLAVSTALGVAMRQQMLDSRAILFAVMALAAGPLGGWLASLIPVRGPHGVARVPRQRTS